MAVRLFISGDHHSNSTVGLSPDEIELEDTIHKASPGQRAINKAWQQILDRTFDTQLPVWSVFLGDAVDMNRHSLTGLVSHNTEDARRIALANLYPVAQNSKHLFVVRGTEAHVGEQAHLEESIAEDLGAEGDGQRFSKWRWQIRVEGLLFDFIHKPKCASRMPWTRDQAAMRESAVILHRCARIGLEIPDVAVRAHVHYSADSGKGMRPHVFYLPPLQICTPFSFQIGEGGDVEPIGALVIDVDDHRISDELMTFAPEENKPWQVSE